MAGLTWNRANAFADGLAEQTGAGITGLGFELLDEMGQLGMALDLSHLSPRGCELALERYGGPVLASHANAAAVFANPRNLADDVLAAWASGEGWWACARFRPSWARAIRPSVWPSIITTSPPWPAPTRWRSG
jgi:microsomal dipeptidase-like Zn-dependent dipeptidase